MDFFGEQDRARRQSHVLLVLFVVVLVCFALVVNGLVSVTGYMLGLLDSKWSVNLVSLLITSSLFAVVLLGCWVRYQDVKGGGRLLAIRFGASPINADSTDAADRRLLNVVAELSLAASVPNPAVFLMKGESAVNAFVVGSGDDMALVISQGSIDKLEREELLGVVGHEFGHLHNGDLAYNMRLLIVLGGLNALDELGKKLIANVTRKPSNRMGPDLGPSTASIPVMVIGFVLRLLGSLGVMAGNIVRASFTRQREFLADASSVQFTRNTYGLASALNKAASSNASSSLHSSYREELAHLCFQMPSRFMFGSLFNTHPSVEQRIEAIDKHFSVKSRQRKAQAERQTDTISNSGTIGSNNELVQANTVVLSDELVQSFSDITTCQVILMAMFISPQAAKAETQLSAIRCSYGQNHVDKVKQLHGLFNLELGTRKMTIIESMVPMLNQATNDSSQQLVSTLEQLIDMSAISFENFAALELIKRTVISKNAESNRLSSHNVDYSQSANIRSIAEMGKELSLLLSLMVEASGYDKARVADEYSRVLKCYTSEQFSVRSASEEGVMEEMSNAFDELSQQPLAQRKAFVQHCTEIMQLDGICMVEEKALINLLAASLDLPQMAVA